MRVPVAVELYGQWIPIRWVDEVDDGGALGEFVLDNTQSPNAYVNMALNAGGKPVNPATLKVTMVHELCHFLFEKSGQRHSMTDNREHAIIAVIEELANVLDFSPTSRHVKWGEVDL